jgi:hypothetical protein
MTVSRRSQRVKLRMPIVVRGVSATGPFKEETHTLVISAHGALIALMEPASPGDLLELQSTASSEIRCCRVVFVGSEINGKNQAAVEFAEPAPHFWQIAFPPVDWTPG